ncbi:MAG: hypothetical protein JW929_01105 [Anaerolineales bacterium]|nr:hypothetical protein [Anaerolineales bacterium]
MPPVRRFIGEPIQVEFTGQPLLKKQAGCPAAFVWRGQRFAVAEMLAEWHDYSRRGRMADNMTPAHARTAAIRGSRGVGRDFFTIRAEGGRTFTLYYDRAPKNAGDQAGAWFLFSEEAGGEAGGRIEK